MECDHDNAPDSLPGPQPVARRQSGMYNWRGGEGSATDLNLYDITEDADASGETYEPVTRPAYTENLTGLVYMQARYYEPETGRFTQADPAPYQSLDFVIGQNNRWTYGANDPLNFSDPDGRSLGSVISWTLIGIGAGMVVWGAIQAAGAISSITATSGFVAILGALALLAGGLSDVFWGLAAMCTGIAWLLSDAGSCWAKFFLDLAAAFALASAGLGLLNWKKVISSVGYVMRQLGTAAAGLLKWLVDARDPVWRREYPSDDDLHRFGRALIA